MIFYRSPALLRQHEAVDKPSRAENESDFSSGKTKNAGKPLRIPRLFNAVSNAVCRKRREF
ncbi:hypothetical protein ANACOL_04391 [Anaerotruncus colihominis DSM 17241]|uniref:Uncharacterized protein n=1 Tax=Anaerotruncus colihominis DSM 17241 TaxID=445972 RepID=B0PHU8_9FIRM|nr:hypothetical protein ANACOL_04391 [Anaerotruncus colihominis DSM 17241]